MSEHYKFFQNRGMRIFSVPQDERSGALQLSVLLLPALRPRRALRRRPAVHGKRHQGLLRLPVPPRPENYDRICARFAELAALCRRPPEEEAGTPL